MCENNLITSVFFLSFSLSHFSSTAVWNGWRKNRTCWSRRTVTSSTWRSSTTTSTRRSPSWRPRSSACTRHRSGCPFPGSTDSGPRRFVRSSPRTATARRGRSINNRWTRSSRTFLSRRSPVVQTTTTTTTTHVNKKQSRRCQPDTIPAKMYLVASRQVKKRSRPEYVWLWRRR